MGDCAIVLRDGVAQVSPKVARLATVVRGDVWDLPAERVLFVGAGVAVPPAELMSAGFGPLERWEVAAPLSGRLACDVGRTEERAATEAACGDLRQPTYETGLLFVRRGGRGEEMTRVWRGEATAGGDEALAFLRALHLVKPLVYALPGGWAAPAAAPAPAHPGRGAAVAERAQGGKPEALAGLTPPAASAPDRETRREGDGAEMVLLEIGPRQYLRCRKGEERESLARYEASRAGRGRPAGGGR